MLTIILIYELNLVDPNTVFFIYELNLVDPNTVYSNYSVFRIDLSGLIFYPFYFNKKFTR